ncbi:hypothetical protein L1887_31246 [Cichorium endivia]|nr:hypothetical protein L1887_31246 [Cichorium endivia]
MDRKSKRFVGLKFYLFFVHNSKKKSFCCNLRIFSFPILPLSSRLPRPTETPLFLPTVKAKAKPHIPVCVPA